MSSNHTSKRTAKAMQALQSVMDLFDNPVFMHRNEDPLACDFALGNPQEMPLSGYVTALQASLPPQNKDWYAYKMSEAEAVVPLAQNLYQWRGVNYATEDIFLTNGAFAGLAVVLGAIVDPGDEVIFNSPPWFFYESMILDNGGIPMRVRVDSQTFDLDLHAIEAAITSRTRAIIVNSPNNPTGKIYPPETLRQLSELLEHAQRKYGSTIYLLSDESYSRIVYDNRRFVSPTQYYPNSFLIYTYGKTLLTPGQRIGYIALPPEMPDKEAVRQGIFISQLLTAYAFPNALLQHALPELDKLSINIQHLQKKRDFMVGALQEMGYNLHSPEGTFYLLPRSPMEDDVAFTNLLNEQKIFCLPGKIVEMPGYFRISLTASDEMIQRALPGFEIAIERAREMRKN